MNDLQKTRRARGPYLYGYAEPTEVGPRAPLQLEFRIPKGRKGGSWVKAAPDEFLDGSYFRTWRKVRPGHKHADKLTHSITRIRDMRCPLNTIERQCEMYLAWARLKGLQTVSVFPGSYGQSAAKPYGLTARAVDPSDYAGNAPITEECDE